MSILQDFNPDTFKASPTNPVPSPCVKVCKLDEVGMCMGCYRDLDEIRVWSSASDAARLAIWQKVKMRLKHKTIIQSQVR